MDPRIATQYALYGLIGLAALTTIIKVITSIASKLREFKAREAAIETGRRYIFEARYYRHAGRTRNGMSNSRNIAALRKLMLENCLVAEDFSCEGDCISEEALDRLAGCNGALSPEIVRLIL